MKKLLLLLPLVFFLTGCYNYRELNDLIIVSGVSINKEDDLYHITVEVVNPKQQQDTSSGNEPDFIIYKSTGTSLQETFRSVVKEAPKKLYLAQMDILIIDEQVAKEDLKGMLEFFARDPETRSEFYVLIGKNTKTLEITTALENISSKKILESLKSNSDYLGTTNLVTYHDLINNFLNSNIEIILPTIEVIGDESQGETIENTENTVTEARPVLSNQAIFKENKLIGYLTEEESIIYNMIMQNSKTPLIKTTYQDNQYIVNEIVSYSSKIEANPKKKKVTITIKGNSNITELNYNCNIESSKTIKKLQNDLNKEIEEQIKTTIKNTTQKYNSDIYGFRDLFYKTDPKEYKKQKDIWYEEIYPNLEIEVKSNIKIFEKGNLNGGILHESE